MEANSLVIRGGNVVTETEILPNHDVVIKQGTIVDIKPTLANARTRETDVFADTGNPGLVVDAATGLPVVDARGAYVVPGMVDIHSDYIESVASPRPSVVMDLPTSLYKVDRELVTHGVTTIYHSLSTYGSHVFDHKPIRNFENVQKLLDAIAAIREGEEHDHLIRHRLHLRVELDAVDRVDEIEHYLTEDKVDLISFMDHTPGQGQYRDLLVYSNTMKGYREGMTDEEVDALIKDRQNAKKISPEDLKRLADLAHEKSISLASHDDDCTEKVEYMDSLGAVISEFPIDMKTAHEAKEHGMFTLAGAPNVMLGHSHSGNLSAREGVENGAIDMLCSDYYPAALIDAVFTLHRECKMSLPSAFALVTANPAKAVGIDNEVGSLEVGKRADILLVREIGCNPEGTVTTPVITRAFVGGNSVYRSHYPDQPQGYDRSEVAVLSIENLSKSFYMHMADRQIKGCQNITLAIQEGEFVGITGRSGSGKSTILRCIYRTNLPESGSIWYRSASFGKVDLCTVGEREMIHIRAYEMGYVSQFLNALPRQTAYDIVLQSALETFGSADMERAKAETERMLHHFDINESLWPLYPRTFSGGEKLRLNIAAAMIKQPRLLLLDEPTASLDAASKMKVRELIEQLKAQGTTMLGIFHDLEFMEGLCDHEFNMQKGSIVA